jgi:tetratricopeptide (TPR) repeat protein
VGNSRLLHFALLLGGIGWAPGCLAQAANPSPVIGQGTPASVPSSNPALDRAKEELSKGRLADALADLKTLETANPKSAEIEHQLALAYYKSGDMLQAARVFARALELDPGDREAVQLRGLALYRTGRPAEAIPLLEQVRSWVPAGGSDVDYILGLCYIDAGRLDEARGSIARQYGLGADSAGAYLIAGQLLLRAHLAPAAIEAGKKAISLDPRLPLAHFLLGEAALFQQDLPGAMQHFEAERTLNPAYAATYDRLGDGYTRQGRYDEAQAALNRSIILDPARTGPYILLGKVMLKRGDALSAEMYLRRANKMDANNYVSHALLGQALRTLGKTDEASRELKAAEELQGDGPARMDSSH